MFPRLIEVRFGLIRFLRTVEDACPYNLGVSSVYRGEVLLNRLLLRVIVQPKRSDRGRSPCAASGLGFDCADGLTFIKEKPSPFVIIITIIKLTPVRSAQDDR